MTRRVFAVLAFLLEHDDSFARVAKLAGSDQAGQSATDNQGIRIHAGSIDGR